MAIRAALAVAIPREDTFVRCAMREEVLRLLMNIAEEDAIGCVLSYLMHKAETSPGRVRACLNGIANKPGMPSARIVDLITQAAQ